MRIEAPEPIPPYTSISLRAEQLNLSGQATVKHVVRSGSKYILGLELSQALRDRTMSVIREADASRQTGVRGADDPNHFSDPLTAEVAG